MRRWAAELGGDPEGRKGWKGERQRRNLPAQSHPTPRVTGKAVMELGTQNPKRLFHKPGGALSFSLKRSLQGAPRNEKGTRVTLIQDQRTLRIRGPPRHQTCLRQRRLRKGFRQAAAVAAQRKAVLHTTLVRHSTVRHGPWELLWQSARTYKGSHCHQR